MKDRQRDGTFAGFLRLYIRRSLTTSLKSAAVKIFSKWFFLKCGSSAKTTIVNSANWALDAPTSSLGSRQKAEINKLKSQRSDLACQIKIAPSLGDTMQIHNLEIDRTLAYFWSERASREARYYISHLRTYTVKRWLSYKFSQARLLSLDVEFIPVIFSVAIKFSVVEHHKFTASSALNPEIHIHNFITYSEDWSRMRDDPKFTYCLLYWFLVVQ